MVEMQANSALLPGPGLILALIPICGEKHGGSPIGKSLGHDGNKNCV